MEWEPFHMFYLVDGLVTEASKVVWTWVNRKVHTNDTTQAWLIFFGSAGMAIVINYLVQFSSLADSVFWIIFIIWTAGPFVLSAAWRRVHIWLDPERALSLAKQYSDGYLAWAYVVTALIVLVAGLKFQSYIATWALLGGGISYVQFGRRRRTGGNRKKRRVNDALRELLRRYRAITQRPRLA